MRHVFGPVPSRRLGRSLGIDPIPFKTCNWNCVYCQLGRTTHATLARRVEVAPGRIAAEVREALQAHRPGDIDWLTIVGSGEPTLYGSLGRLIGQIRRLTTLPMAVITNGALLHEPDVRAELLGADAVLPTLDAGSEALYQKINRPLDRLPFATFVEGLVAFRAEYRGRLWVEVMLVKGLNDSEQALRDIAAVLSRVRPDQIHVNLPIRPPSEPWVEVPGAEAVERALALLGPVAHVVAPTTLTVEIDPNLDVAAAIVAILQRHPLTEHDFTRILPRWTADQIRQALDTLAADGRIQKIERHGRPFWSSAGARYVDEAFSLRHASSPIVAADDTVEGSIQVRGVRP